MTTNNGSRTTIDEIAPDIYRISTPVSVLPGGFTFNQFLIADEEPLLFHTGLRRMFPLVLEAVSKVLPPERLRYVGLSHFEADESGALNEFLDAAPQASPICSQVAAMVSINDVADRPARALGDGEILTLGRHRLRWLDTPHLPHGWDCGVLFDETTNVLFCGDLFTRGGADHPPVTESEILGPSEAFRQPMDYFAHARNTRQLIEKLAERNPGLLACMHGSAFRGDGSAMLRGLADVLEGRAAAAG